MGSVELPVSLTASLSSAEELVNMLDRVDLHNAYDAVWVLWQAELLYHWTTVMAAEAPDYPGLAAGLAEFAVTAIERVRHTET